ncbi:MAG TPA: response regulator [Acidimicrobiales bacterium]|nr:response regulator [Acidimicrobiales bacterium]
MELFGHLINDRLSSGSLLPNPGAPVIRVVIVDDSEVTRRLLRAVLDSDERFEVVAEATDGECAVATAQSHCPDLLLMDLNMPGMDGYTALPKVQAVCPQAKVVILSANSSEGHQEQLSALGAAAVLEKDRPFSEILSAAARVVAPPTASPSVA